MLAVVVVFTSTVEFHISAVYMGRVPEAEQNCKLYPGNVRTTVFVNITLGRADEKPVKSWSN